MKFVVALLLTMTAIPASESTPLRILCWNLHHGVGEDGKLDLERIAKVIREAKPDLVALQEVDNRCSRSRKVDQTAELARLTGMTGVFGKAMDFDSGAYGQAILSRFPITHHQVHSLPGDSEPRIAFEATISSDRSKLRLISLHFDTEAQRRPPQAEVASKLAESSPLPAILCGDFNDTPKSPTLVLFEPTWTPAPKQEPALTHPAGKPAIEIDHFFIRGFTPAKPVKVLTEAVASDHRPLLAEFIRK